MLAERGVEQMGRGVVADALVAVVHQSAGSLQDAPGRLPVLLLAAAIAVEIDLLAFLAGQLLRQLNRATVGLVELEGLRDLVGRDRGVTAQVDPEQLGAA